MRFKRKHLAEALNIDNRGIKHFTKNKSQKVVVSETQLTRLMSNVMEQDEKDANLPGGTNQTKNKAAAQSRDRGVQELINDKVNWNAMSKNEQNAAMGEGYTSTTWSEKINIDTADGVDSEVMEDSEGQETYDYASSEGHDEYRLKHDDMSRSHRSALKKDMGYDEEHEYRGEEGTHFWESKKLTTTNPITESEVKEISKFMNRMGTTGKNYNPAPKAVKSNNIRVEELYEDINKTYRVIRKAIINEGTAYLKVKNYQEVLLEQGMYDRNPGIAAGEGIETIIDNIKRAYSYIKDSRTRKQIMNTLTKVNNFMTYTGELVGSGQSQRRPRTYDQVANPLPYPDLEQSAEDSEEELSEFHEKGMFNPGDGADDESYDGHHFEDDVIGAYDDDLTGKAREGEIYEQGLPDQDSEDMIQGISTSLLHPVTQDYLRKRKTMNVFQIIRMMTDCHWKTNSIDPAHPLVVLQMAGYGYSGNEIEVNPKFGSDGKGAKFCFRPQRGRGEMVCFNPCKLSPDPRSWGQSLRQGEGRGWVDEIVPTVSKILNDSSIDNGYGAADEQEEIDRMEKGGNMLEWRADGDGINARFSLKRK